MDIIWANRLVAGTKTWVEVPDARKYGVKMELHSRVTDNRITPEKYKEITGEKFKE